MKTKRIRIAVVIDADGRWNAVGWSNNNGGALPDADVEDAAIEGFEGFGDLDYSRTVWVTADVPLPELPPAAEVVGEVEK